MRVTAASTRPTGSFVAPPLALAAPPGVLTRRFANAAASLPEDIELANGTIDLRVVSGDAGWSERAIGLIEGGIAGVLVVDPEHEEIHRLKAVAAEACVPVVIHREWASDPSVPEAARAIDHQPGGGLWIDGYAAVAENGSGRAACLKLLELISSLAGPVHGARVIQRTAATIAVTAQARGCIVTARVVETSSRVAAGARVRWIGTKSGVDVHVSGASAASPGTATETRAEGLVTHPSLYESADRAALRRLAYLARARRTTPDLDMGFVSVAGL